MSTDPFEEFEFKPLTEGLGFHKKAEQLKTSMQSSGIASEKLGRSIPVQAPDPIAAQPPRTSSATDSISKLIASLPPTFSTPHLDFLEEPPPKSKPLPQIQSQMQTTLAATPALAPKAGPNSALGSALGSTPGASLGAFKKTEFQTRLDESFAKAFPKTAPKAAVAKAKVTKAPRLDLDLDIQPLAASWPAALLDALMVLGVSTLGLVIILLITKVDLINMLTSAETDKPTQFHLALLYLSMLQFYMLISRSFFGSTLGEWSFGAQMGTSADQMKAIYPIQVAWRTLLLTGTVFILPILSYFFKRDLLKPLTGLQLYRHV